MDRIVVWAFSQTDVDKLRAFASSKGADTSIVYASTRGAAVELTLPEGVVLDKATLRLSDGAKVGSPRTA